MDGGWSGRSLSNLIKWMFWCFWARVPLLEVNRKAAWHWEVPIWFGVWLKPLLFIVCKPMPSTNMASVPGSGCLAMRGSLCCCTAGGVNGLLVSADPVFSLDTGSNGYGEIPISTLLLSDM